MYNMDCYRLCKLYINPPWDYIGYILVTLARSPFVRAMMVVPQWTTALWCRLAKKFVVLRDPIYLDNLGRLRPKPHWNTVVGIIELNC